MALIDNCVGAWHMDNDAWADGTGLNSVTSSDATFSTTHKLGTHSGSFDGSTSTEITDDERLDLTSAGTIACWVKTTTTSNSAFVDKNVSGQGWNLLIYSNVVLFQNNASSYFGTTDIHDGDWHFIVARWNGTTASIWVDGSEEENTPQVGALSDNNNDMRIGKDQNGNYQYTGLIDEIGLWDRYLSDAEIEDLWNDGDGNPYPFESAGGGNKIPLRCIPYEA